jgi:transcription elongation factor Elf1
MKLEVTIRCVECGHRQKMDRIVIAPETMRAVCHSCEAPMKVVITSEAFKEAKLKKELGLS